MKYEIGDLVSKPVTGICKIDNILYLNPQDEKNNKLYYLMKLVEDEKEKIYVPVSNSDARYFQIAENLLYMELGVALGKPKQEICKTIIEYINQSKQEA